MTEPSTAASRQTASNHASGHRHSHGHQPHGRKEIAALSLGALGVVYGDIGTSPLYAMNECVSASKAHAIHPINGAYVPEQLFGVLSLFFWAMMLVVVLKYLVFVLRADNKGEGGI